MESGVEKHPQELLTEAVRRYERLLGTPELGLATWHMAAEAAYQKLKRCVELEERRREESD